MTNTHNTEPGDDASSSAREAERMLERRRAAALDAGRRFASLCQQAEYRQDLAWSPPDFEPDPCGPETLFFYRPGELLVRAPALQAVRAVLQALGVRICELDRRQGARIVRLLVASREPVPELLRLLRCYGLGLDQVGPNHVYFGGQEPWYSGGGVGLPQQVDDQPDVTDRTAKAQVAVFDTGLLTGYNQPPLNFSWLRNVQPCDALQNKYTLDIYDNHGLFVSGIIGYTAPQASIYVRTTLSEFGTVSDTGLAEAIDQYLQGLSECPSDVRLVNLSLGGTTMDNVPPIAMQDLVNNWPNVVFVASAGNTGSADQLFYPAALPQVVGVGALNRNSNTPAPFSNSSPSSAKVWARGVDVVSAFRPGTLQPPAPLPPPPPYTSGLAKWSGTSFAAPRVTATLCDYVTTTSQPTGYGALAWLAQHYQSAPGQLIIIP